MSNLRTCIAKKLNKVKSTCSNTGLFMLILDGVTVLPQRSFVPLWFLVSQCTDTTNAVLLGDGRGEHVVALLLPAGDASPQLTLETPRTANVQLLVSLLENDLQIGPALHHTPVHL